MGKNVSFKGKNLQPAGESLLVSLKHPKRDGISSECSHLPGLESYIDAHKIFWRHIEYFDCTVKEPSRGRKTVC